MIAGEGEPSLAGGKRPIFNTVTTLARLAGSLWRECVSSDPASVLAFITAPAHKAPQLLLVNVTPASQKIELGTLGQADQFANGVLTLEPYAVGSIALAD